ncbi:MAG: LD-carboxypeptidase, partial [Microbacterium sp.]
SWIDIASSRGGTVIRQSPAGVHHAGEWEDWTANPGLTTHTWNGSGTWRRLDRGTGPIDVSGRLIGGCIETVAPLAGSRYGDTAPLRGADGNGTTLVYLEASEENAFLICRALHGMRLAGFFDGASAVLIGRTSAPDAPTLTQDEAVLDALASLDLPIVADVECGHVPPQMSIVNGCSARLVHGSGHSYLDQTLGSWSQGGAVNHAT